LNHDSEIASKNLVFFRKSFGEFQLGIFDPIESMLDFSSASVSPSSYVHSDAFSIGESSSSYWSNGRSFLGSFDDFYCLTGKIPQTYLLDLFSGFYSIPVTGGLSGTGLSCQTVTVLSGSGVILGTGITGYELTISYLTGTIPASCFYSGYSYFVGRGVTGYEKTYLGSPLDACDIPTPIYVDTPITGDIYASGYAWTCSGATNVVTPVYSTVALSGEITGEEFIPITSGTCSGIDIYNKSISYNNIELWQRENPLKKKTNTLKPLQIS
jgi:hypothetical protein